LDRGSRRTASCSKRARMVDHRLYGLLVALHVPGLVGGPLFDYQDFDASGQFAGYPAQFGSQQPLGPHALLGEAHRVSMVPGHGRTSYTKSARILGALLPYSPGYGAGVLDRGYTIAGVPMESKLGTQLYYCPKNYVVGDR
jgi:hypothetical protein